MATSYVTPTFLILPHTLISLRKILHLLQPQAMSWTYSKCTFINPPSQKSTCQICSSSSVAVASPSSSSPSTPRWSCKACTFLNPYRNSNCGICSTRASVSSLSTLEDLTGQDDDELDSSVGSVFLPLQPCNKRKVRNPVSVSDGSGELSGFRGAKSANKAVSMSEGTDSGTYLSSLKILSYNVWFREDLEMFERMKALGDLIQLHSPDLICFQEVTPNIYEIFQQSSWWKLYQCSVSKDTANLRPYFCLQLSKLSVKSFNCKPFSNSIMGRELCVVDTEVQSNKQLVVATSHLESPCPAPPKWDQMFSKERVSQAAEALNFLKKYPNVIFCGDMNWDDKLDGQFPLPEGWLDAWEELRPRENGWTYDTKSNQMLSGNRTLQKRLDRFVCSLRDFKITEINMIGTEAIPGLTYFKEKKVKKEMQKLVLPVLPSDHFGLLLTICGQ